MPFPDPPAVRYNNTQTIPPPDSGIGTFVPPPHGDPPALFRGYEWDGESGEMSFSCAFELFASYTRDIPTGIISTLTGPVFTGIDHGAGLGVNTGLGINFSVNINASGQCVVAVNTALAELDANLGINSYAGPGNYRYGFGTSGTVYDTGPSFIDDEEADGGIGHRFLNDHDMGPCQSTSNSAKGTFSCYLRLAEYKGVSVTVLNGQGEPDGSLEYAGFTFPQWEWGYSVSIETQNPDVREANPGSGYVPWPASGGFGVGERYLYTLANPTAPGDQQYYVLTGVTYDDLRYYNSAPGYRPLATADINIGGEQASCTKINFSSGPWTPVPYTGRRRDDPHDSSVAVDVGQVVVVNNHIDVMAASSTPAHLIGRVYRGDTLYPGTLLAQFGSAVGAGSGVVGYASLRDVEIVDGKIDVYLPQIRCIYYGHQVVFDPLPDPTAATVWIPALPLNRDDYAPNGMQLYPLGEYVNQIKFLDDYSWRATTFHQARQIKVEDFSDVSGWGASGGTVASGPGLKMTATGTNFVAYTTTLSGANPSATPPVPPRWDCRNYRYLQMTAVSSADGGPLTLTLNGDGKFKTQALKAGSNVLTIDLCNPDTALVLLGLTRTGWDKDPDARYGVYAINALRIEGLANGQTVTLADLTLIRKDEAAPGYVAPETTGYTGSPEAYWYTPDRAFEGFTCGFQERPDDIFQSLTRTNHTYARLLQTYSDGKRAADIPHAIGSYSWYYPTSPPVLKGYISDEERLTVAEFCSLVNTQTGLSCDPPVDGDRLYWYNVTRTHAVWLTRDNYYLADGLPDDVGSAPLTAPPSSNLDGAALMCRLQFDTIKSYPGQFRRRDYAFCKRMHWVYEGTVATPDGSSAEGTVVTLTPCSDFAHEGPLTVKADRNGYFRFPYVANALCTIKTSLSDGWQVYNHDRATSWIGLTGRPPAYGGQPSYDVSETGRHVRAYVSNASFNVVIGLGDGPVPVTLSWTDTETRIGDTWPVVRWERRARQPRLFLVSKSGDSSDINLRWSADEGRSWTLTTFDSASASTTATFAETDHGLKYIYYRTTTGAIKGQILDAQLNVVQGEFTAIAADVDDTGITAREFQVGGGLWYIGLLYVSGSRLLYKTSRDGINFS